MVLVTLQIIILLLNHDEIHSRLSDNGIAAIVVQQITLGRVERKILSIKPFVSSLHSAYNIYVSIAIARESGRAVIAEEKRRLFRYCRSKRRYTCYVCVSSRVNLCFSQLGEERSTGTNAISRFVSPHGIVLLTL